MLAAASMGHAQNVWDGPMISYNQPTPDPTQVSNQDRITPDVWFTRAKMKGLFNAFSETSAGTLSPSNTVWAFGSITNYSSLTYTNWLALLNGNSPVTLIGQPMVVYLPADNIYFSILITNWAAGGGGGFGYLRSTPVVNYSQATAGNGRFSFNYTTQANFSYVVQSSPDLVNWVSVSTNTAAGSSMSFTNLLNPGGTQFYQVNLLPQQ